MVENKNQFTLKKSTYCSCHRAIDHLNRGTMDLSGLEMLIMDEADEMLKMGFQEDLETLLKDTPQNRQTALFFSNHSCIH